MRQAMVLLLALGLAAAGVRPAAAEEPGSILAAAERLAAETRLQSDFGGTRRSGARVGIGVAMAAAGAAMLLIDPTQPVQPTQPGVVTGEQLGTSAADLFLQVNPWDARAQLGATRLVCEPFCLGAIDEAILEAYAAGGVIGIAAAVQAIDSQPWTLYADQFQPFIPFKERSPALKYGGAALVVGGALIAGFWSDVPVLRDVTVAATPGGVTAARTLSW